VKLGIFCRDGFLDNKLRILFFLKITGTLLISIKSSHFLIFSSISNLKGYREFLERIRSFVKVRFL
jgi:hypothetical protein